MNAAPVILPVFPLTGALLLPGGRLPLHIFEERYRNMVEDSLAGAQTIGLIQPMRGGAEPDGEADDVFLVGSPDEGDGPRLYEVGCAGVLERSERLPDGRFIILLKGTRRFRVRRELPLVRGYRRVEADYAGFDVDAEDVDAEVSPDSLLGALRTFAELHQVPLELDRLGELSGLALLNSVAMALPFQPAEKQALLEAPDVVRRHEMLLTLLDMGVDLRSDASPPAAN